MNGPELLIPILAIFFIIGVPVMGLVARFAIQPMIRELASAIRGGGESGVASSERLEARLERIEGALERQERLIDDLLEAERFHRELESGEPRRPEELEGRELAKREPT